jgi:hypothetical protein
MFKPARAVTASTLALTIALAPAVLGSAAFAAAAPAPAGAPPAPGRLHELLSHDLAALPGTGAHPLSIVTLYAPASDPQWATVDNAAPTVAGATVNICDAAGNGPGCNSSDWTSKDAAWDSTVSGLQAAGITPLIYLTTDNGAISVSTLETEMSQAQQWWGITTPFFDQMAGTEGTSNDGSGICADGGADIPCSSYYGQLYSYAMAHSAQAVMFNPGSWFGMSPAFMYGPDEILQGFENDESTLQANSDPAPSWADSYGQFQFAATVASATQSGLGTDLSDATTDQHAGFIYENDENEPPSYSTLAPWFGAFLTDLEGDSLADPSALYEVQASQQSGYCLDNSDGSSDNGNPIQIWRCLHDASQQWQYVPSLDGVAGDFELQNSTGMCLDDTGDFTVNGTKVQLWACLGDRAQIWTQRPVNGSYVEYVNGSGLCLDNTGNSGTDGTRVQVWACSGDRAQQWYGPSPSS